MHIGLASLSKEESPPEPKSRGVRRWSLGAWNGRAVAAISISAFFLPFLGVTSTMSRIEPLIETAFSPVMQGLTEGISMVVFLLTGGAILHLVARFWLEWQTVVVDDEALTVEYSVFGRTRRMRYLRRYISELHVACDVPEDVKSFGFDSAGVGTFAFQYGSQTVRFGPDRLKHEAEKKLNEILAFAPDLAEPAPLPGAEVEDAAEWKRDPECISPLEHRFALEQHGSDVRVTIPFRSGWYVRVMSILYLVNWTALACFAIPILWLCFQNLPAELPEGVSASDLKWTIGLLIFYLVICTFAVPSSLWALVWVKWGRQVIIINPARIEVRTRPVFRGGRRIIDRKNAGSIHIRTVLDATAPPAQQSDRTARRGWFECSSHSATHHFGAGFTRRESEYLLEQLRRIDPALVAPA